jgi:hypothetical protein
VIPPGNTTVGVIEAGIIVKSVRRAAKPASPYSCQSSLSLTVRPANRLVCVTFGCIERNWSVYQTQPPAGSCGDAVDSDAQPGRATYLPVTGLSSEPVGLGLPAEVMWPAANWFASA